MATAFMKAPTVALHGQHLSGGPSDVEYAAVSSTGAYYVIGNNNTQLWRYMNGTWTELLTPNYSFRIPSVAINPFNPRNCRRRRGWQPQCKL